MVIFKKIYQDYRASMKSKQSDNSSDNVEFVTLNFIVGKIREQERNNRESPRRAYVDKVVKPILIAHAKQQSEMIDDLLKINSKDKKILKSVNEMKEAINICLRYLTDQELKSVEIPVETLSAGMYSVNVKVGDQFVTENLSVIK